MIRIYKTKIINQKRKITLTLKNAVIPLNGRQKVLNACASGIFPKRKQREELTSISDHVAPVAPIVRVAKVSDHKVFDHKQRKILTDNTLIKIHVNKIEIWTTFKIKTGYYLELLTSHSTKNEVSQ